MLHVARRLSLPRSTNKLYRLPLYLSTSPLPPCPPPPPPPSLRLPFLRSFSSHSFSSSSSPPPSPLPPLALLRGGCYDSSDSNLPSLPLCPGCGVHMQDSDPTLPGFFSRPSPKSPDYRARLHLIDDDHLSLSLKSGLLPLQEEEEEEDEEEEEEEEDSDHPPLVCARCHSLRHYGQVKNPSAENLLPDFDFDRAVAPKMASPSGPRNVVLMVVDAADFDGSFPRKVARLISASIDVNSANWKRNEPANVPRVVLVVSKVDLLPPSSISPEWLEEWARNRARVGGATKIAGLHMVSAARNWGVRELVEHVRELAGVRGNVWAVGAQNAGKSTLLNAMGRCTGGNVSHLTEAPVPGTTLGIVRMEGVLGTQAKLFDTPGILHPYQITTRLTREEQKLVHVSKELRPRTYRIKVGHSVHIGGLMRLDVEESSVDTIYVTVWASPLLPLHMGKTENAPSMIENHFGLQLQPPIGAKRIDELGKWVRREFTVTGNSWEASSVDIASAGLGWFAIGLKGDAVLGVWTYDGVDVVSRNSLISKRASIFEEAGFTVSKIVSQADRSSSKLKHIRKEKKKVGSKSISASPPSTKDDSAVSA